MAPPKASPLKAIRAQAAAYNRLNPRARPGSAFSLLGLKDQRSKPGSASTTGTLNGSEQPTRRKKQKKKVSKIIQTKLAIAPDPPEPTVEYWQPAGGHQQLTDHEKQRPCSTLGIARVATWRVPTFLPAVRQIVEEIAEVEEMATRELVHGGQSSTDVFVRLGGLDELGAGLVAEMVREALDGRVVGGRKLRVGFARGVGG